MSEYFKAIAFDSSCAIKKKLESNFDSGRSKRENKT